MQTREYYHNLTKVNSRNKWINLLTKENYKTLVTIQPKMKNKYMFENRMSSFFNLPRVDNLFYSVEQNANKKGFHIHLMFNAHQCNREHLAFALDTPLNTIPYYEDICSQVAVSNYVTKHMKGDQIHYNFFKK